MYQEQARYCFAAAGPSTRPLFPWSSVFDALPSSRWFIVLRKKINVGCLLMHSTWIDRYWVWCLRFIELLFLLSTTSWTNQSVMVCARPWWPPTRAASYKTCQILKYAWWNSVCCLLKLLLVAIISISTPLQGTSIFAPVTFYGMTAYWSDYYDTYASNGRELHGNSFW